MEIKSHVKFFYMEVEPSQADDVSMNLVLLEIQPEDRWVEVRIEHTSGIYHLEFNQTSFPLYETVDTTQCVFGIQAIVNEAQEVLENWKDQEDDFDLYVYERRINELVIGMVPNLRDRLENYAQSIATSLITSVGSLTTKQLN